MPNRTQCIGLFLLGCAIVCSNAGSGQLLHRNARRPGSSDQVCGRGGACSGSGGPWSDPHNAGPELERLWLDTSAASHQHPWLATIFSMAFLVGMIVFIVFCV